MMEENYRIALAEVDETLKYTEEELLQKIPQSMLKFIKENKAQNYIPHLTAKIPIEEQKLTKETEAMLSLIYRSYWATEKEKEEFAEKDKEELEIIEKEKQEKYFRDNLFTKRSKTIENEITNIVNVSDMPWYKKIYNKLRKWLFYKRTNS